MINLPCKNGISLRLLALRSSTYRHFTDNGKGTKNDGLSQTGDKDDKTSEDTQKSSHEEGSAAAKLNRLLESMATEDSFSLLRSQPPNLPIPGNLNSKRRHTMKEDGTKRDVFAAVKGVAKMSGDAKQEHQTESELLNKLLGHRENNVTEDNESSTKKISTSDINLSELIVGMKIDRTPLDKKSFSRSDYVRRNLAARNPQQTSDDKKTNRVKKFQLGNSEPEPLKGSVNIFGAEPLGIFKNTSDFKEPEDMLNTWKLLQQRELQLQVTYPPSNYWEKIALWTQQGKVWRFPIDNEQDWKLEEADVDFSEHIFLEQHLAPWCPDKGPIRHFMELVCVGLYKNPYITAQEKKEHILWYRDYFENKKEILKDYIFQESAEHKKDKDRIA